MPRILLVEDEEAHAELIARAFDDRPDVDLTVASSLGAARSLIGESPPDLAIVDLLLPDGRGIELFSADSEPGFPAVMMTSHGDEQVAVEVMKAGVLDYVVKSESSFLELPRTADRALREWGHIADRRRVEQALHQSEEHFRSLIENALDVIAVLDGESRIDYINPSVEKVLGRTPSSMRGKKLVEFVHPEDVETLERVLQSSVSIPDIVQSVEYRARHRDGSWHYLESLCSAHPPSDGEPRCVLNSRDATRRRLDQEARRRADRERLVLEHQLQQSQKMEALGQLAAGVAHDFNNVLTVIAGHTAFLDMAGEPGGPQTEHIEAIRGALDRATALSRQLLAFGRRQVMRPVVLDVNQTIRGVQGMLRRLITEKVKLSVEADEEVGPIIADPTHIEQVLMNLAVNARDAMPDGGRLFVRTKSEVVDQPKAVGDRALAEGHYSIIEVEDTGCGMDETTKTQIFEPFFTTKPRGKGTGLGLSTVYGIVKQTGGQIDVDTAPGEGCRIRVYLPTVEEAVTTVEVSAKREIAERGHETVLVVEDDDAMRRLVSQVLAALGYQVQIAADGEEGVRAIENSDIKIDLLLTDLVMPGLNGRQVAEAFRQQENAGEVLYMSGYADDTFGPQVQLEALDNFLEKPFSPGVLARKVREVLDQALVSK